MSIELKFDWARFGCNEQNMKNLVAEIVRCVNSQGIEEQNLITLSAPEGVWVKPGMRAKYMSIDVTVAPYAYGESIRDGVSFWLGDGTSGYAFTKDAGLTCGGMPVLGYDEDKP